MGESILMQRPVCLTIQASQCLQQRQEECIKGGMSVSLSCDRGEGGCDRKP